MKDIVRIGNPIPGEAKFTSLKQAERKIRQGRAKWNTDKTLIWFTDDAHIARYNAAVYSMIGYDGNVARGSVATEKQIRGLPCVNPMALLIRRSKNGQPRV